MSQESESQAGSSSQEAEDMQLDEMEVDPKSSRAQKKVELDLDDAPFLDWSGDDEEAEETDPDASEEEEAGEREDDRSAPSRRKWVLLGSVSGLLLLGSALALIWMAKSPESTVKSASRMQGGAAPETQGEKQQAEGKKLDLRPFWVEYKQGDRLRYLHFEFALGLEQAGLAWEVKRKIPLLRDGVFYYLKNKGLAFLSEKENVRHLKEDLRGVINQSLSQGQIKDILIQEYVVE